MGRRGGTVSAVIGGSEGPVFVVTIAAAVVMELGADADAIVVEAVRECVALGDDDAGRGERDILAEVKGAVDVRASGAEGARGDTQLLRIGLVDGHHDRLSNGHRGGVRGLAGSGWPSRA